MTEFGLTKDGFRLKRYADILPEMERRARELFGNDVNLSESSPLGMLIRLNAWDEALVWQQMENIYLSGFISTSEGISLDRNVQNLGIMRRLATRATGEIQIFGTDGTIVLEGFRVQTATGIVFQTVNPITLSGGYAIAQIEAVEPGINGNVEPGLINQIVTPVAGVTSVTNPNSTSGGRDTETDAELRIRYTRSVSKPGGSSLSAIEAALLDIDGVLDAIIRENTTMVLDESTGLPPKSISPVIWGGDPEIIANTLFQTKPGGIQCWGEDEVFTIIDSYGMEHQIGFNRPELVTINVEAEIGVNPVIFPLDGIERIEAAIENYLNSLGLNRNVIFTRIISEIHSVPGVTDILSLEVNGGTSNIEINEMEVAVPGTITVTMS